ncbi:peroxiredoxin family protein [Psychroserpens sp. MEBiC05023]
MSKNDLSLVSIFGDDIPKLENLQGKPLLILFFYLGCPGCKGRAIPFANKLVYENTPIHIIGIHSRFEGKVYSNEELKQAKDEFYIRFPYYSDKNHDDTFKSFEAGGTPHWILLNKDGEIVQSIFGSDPNNALLRIDLKLKELLNMSK